MAKVFKRAERNKYTNEEKLELGELKEDYYAEVKRNEGKTKYDAKRKRHVPIKPSTGYAARAVRSFYSDLADISNNDPEFIKAVKLAFPS